MRKISELTTENGLDVLCEITPYINNIVTCESLHNELGAIAEGKPEDIKDRFAMMVYGADVFSRLIPILLKERRADVYGILAAINGQSVDDVAKKPITRTLADIRALFKDKALLDFFKSFVGGASNE